MEEALSKTENGEAWKNGALHAIMKMILNPTETQRNHRSYLNSWQRYKTFEEGLKKESGRNVELLLSGSMAECLFAQHWVYKDGRREALNDIDIMLVDCSITVVERSQLVQLECSGVVDKDQDCQTAAVIKMNSCNSTAKCCRQEQLKPLDTITPASTPHSQKELLLEPTNHAGYVQLYELSVEGKPVFLSVESFKGFWSGIVNKTALYSLVTSGPQLPSGGAVVSGPALNRRDRPNRRNNYAHDYVPCLHWPKWPTMANRWCERKRTVEWPGERLICDIMSDGCHVVPVSHHDNDDKSYHTEWRLSFSSAEKRLVNSLSMEQRQSYIIAKLIMKQVIKEIQERPSQPPLDKTPSSYHLKTILLWKCEEKPLEEWNNLLNSAVGLLKTFEDRLRKGNIPNYFIPENNMISHIKHYELVAVADGIAASLDDLPKTLHLVFLSAYNTVLDYDHDYSPVLRLVDYQLKLFCHTGKAGDKLYLLYILNLLVDSLSATITGIWDDLQPLKDYEHILNIYCSHCNVEAGHVTLPRPPDLGAEESSKTMMILFQYLYTLLQDNHILNHLQTDIFAVMSRILMRTLPSLSLSEGTEELFGQCCKESLNIFQTVCKKLGIGHSSDLSCHDELTVLSGIEFIFFKSPEFAELQTFEFATQRLKKFKEGGQLETVRHLQW